MTRFALRLLVILIVRSVLTMYPAVSADDTLAAKVQALKPGKRIEVTMNNGDRQTGKFSAAGAAGFTFAPEGKNQAVRDVPYTEVKTVKTKMTRGAKWGIAGGIYGGLVVIGLILGG